MQFATSTGGVPASLRPSAVTFGKFDGMHVGHQEVISALRAVAAERGLSSVVLTFDRNPLSLLDPARSPESIVSNEQKRELLEASGVDAMVQLPFDRALSSLTADDFVRDVLVRALGARVVLVGPGTRYGRQGSGDFARLAELGAELGFEVRQLELHLDSSGEPVSSTRIRSLLAEGNVREAGRLLGRRPSVRAVIVHGQKRGRALGYPTANFSRELEGYIPADGVYAGLITIGGRTMPAAVSIGNNPTFDGVPARQVEAHVLDEDLDLYDQVASLEFVDFIRGMVKYTTLDDLIAQMGRDTERVREILASV